MYVIIRQSVVITLFLALILCGAYPLCVTGAGQILFPSQANGSLVVRAGTVIGSRLIGQRFSGPGYFQGRPSAAGQGYDGLASGGSNLGPTSAALARRMTAEAARLRLENPGHASLPVDLLTASGSGLDPHVSPEAAMFQVGRVASARGLSPERVAALIQSRIEGPELGIFGPARINVLELNLALDEMHP
jgi:K+-transporting ATPase ATPase C chain